MNTYFYGQIIHDKGERIYNGGKTVSSISDIGKTGHLQCKGTKLEHFPHTILKNKLKMD